MMSSIGGDSPHDAVSDGWVGRREVDRYFFSSRKTQNRPATRCRQERTMSSSSPDRWAAFSSTKDSIRSSLALKASRTSELEFRRQDGFVIRKHRQLALNQRLHEFEDVGNIARRSSRVESPVFFGCIVRVEAVAFPANRSPCSSGYMRRSVDPGRSKIPAYCGEIPALPSRNATGIIDQEEISQSSRGRRPKKLRQIVDEAWSDAVLAVRTLGSPG